ncbi:AzlC family ABC transporter permease [Bordetella genomosp. 4]|uniref:AzlC family ABC transporter permease n=1 Tax=Bordetella genomosp. 4 TaxID=463044 RepID=UPI000B9DF1DC|nr:AzlC family ABC transporter permease [Bordetella genomosp. 4]OZI41556.1 branched-chain amino acid ABC transporter permease [Bordetella genomosp. 4]
MPTAKKTGAAVPPLSDHATPWAQCCAGALASLPVLFGIIPFGLVLGAQAAQKGLTPFEVPLLTGLNFAGGSEFAALGLWAAPPPLLLIMAVTFLVNSRMLVMGAAMTPFLRHLPKRKVLPSLFLMTDASWALSMADTRRRAQLGIEPAFSLAYYMGTSLVFYVAWIGCTTLGAILGPLLGHPEVYGLDMAFPAVFLVMLRGMWRGVRRAVPWLVSLLAAIVTYKLVPGAWYVAAGAMAGIVTAVVWTPRPPQKA